MFEISPATSTDLETICRIGGLTFSDAYAEYNTKEDLEAYINTAFAEEKVQGELGSETSSYYLCKSAGNVVGYLKLNFDRPCEAFSGGSIIELQRIYVLKEYYRKKAGTQLMKYALDLGNKRHYKYLWLGVWKENHRALKFYAAHGFEIIGERNFKLGNKLYEDFYLRRAL